MDRDSAAQVHQWLVADGHEVFLDRDLRDGIPVGDEWDKRLHERLRWADAVVCVVTSAAVASTWCSAEVGIALSRGIRVLPVRAESGVDHPLLRSAQYADLTVDSTEGRAALVESLRQIDRKGGSGWPDDRSPFPGLRPFDVTDRLVFFGRSGEVEQLAGLLRSPAERAERAVLLVMGPSGCGKSSLVRAGLLPVMTEEPGWLVLPPMLPGVDPMAALARELAAAARELGLGWTVTQVRHQLGNGDLTGLADELLVAARARRLLLVVDQFEELVTQTPPGHRARFAQLLRPALGGPVQVVGTLRPEFLDQLLADVDLAVLPTRHYLLRPLRREALRAVIEDPARLAGIDIAEDLVARLIDDTDSGEALPLLAFTLAQLADGANRGDRLSQQRYDQLGGVQGALIRQADAALTEATAATGRRREDVIAGLLRLVTVDERGRPSRWRVDRAQLPEPVTRELDVFVGRRLVTTDTDNGSVAVGVAHEAFLSAWPPLVQAIDGNVSALRARRAVEQAAAGWHDAGRLPTRLWERGQLAAAMADTGARLQARDLVTDRVELSSTARHFLRAGLRRDRVRRQLASTVLSVLLVLALVAAGFAFIQQRSAERQRNMALSQQVAGQAQELRASNPPLAAQLSLAAYRLDPTTEARSSLLSTAANPDVTLLTRHSNNVKRVAFSPTRAILATGSDDTTVQLWDARDPRHPHLLKTLTNHTNYVSAAAFSLDGNTLATGSDDKTVQLWDVRDPRNPKLAQTLAEHDDVVLSVTFSPDGKILATGGTDHTVHLWDIRLPGQARLLRTLEGYFGDVTSVAFSPTGNTLAIGGWDKTLRLWDVRDPQQARELRILTTGTDPFSSVAFSPDGNILAAGSWDKTVQLWDVSDVSQARLLYRWIGHLHTIRSVAFNVDGHTLATASEDSHVRLWDIHDPSQPRLSRTLSGHTNTVTSVAFSHDGNTLATGSYDNTVRLWELHGPLLDGHAETIASVAFSPGRPTLATASFDQTLQLWDVHDQRRPSLLSALDGHPGGVFSATFSPDGQTLATAGRDAIVRLWDVGDLRNPQLLTTLIRHTNDVLSVAFSPDGSTLATASTDDTVRLWDVGDLRNPQLLTTLIRHTNDVLSVAFSPDGSTLATASADKTVGLWDVRDPRILVQPTIFTAHDHRVNSVVFSHDGQYLATASNDNTARLWNVRDPGRPHRIAVLDGHTGIVNLVAFSNDGRTLATASNDKTARLWDVRDPGRPNLSAILTGHMNGVSSAAFSSDGRTLATASIDKTARLWETDPESAATRICTVTPTISEDDWSKYLHDLPYRSPCPQAA